MLGALSAVLTAPAHAATEAQVRSWLASSAQIVRSNEVPPRGSSVKHAIELRGSDVRGWVVPSLALDGALVNGQEVMVLPLVSGGSGGVFTALLFTKLGGKARFVGYVPSPNGHLDIALDDGMLLIRTPIYGPGSGGNCCPSDFHFERATLRGIRLVTLAAWTVPASRVNRS